MSFSLIILAGGNSHRFKSNIGKPYQKIAGKSLVEINVDKARKFNKIKKIILVYNKKDSKKIKSLTSMAKSKPGLSHNRACTGFKILGVSFDWTNWEPSK